MQNPLWAFHTFTVVSEEADITRKGKELTKRQWYDSEPLKQKSLNKVHYLQLMLTLLLRQAPSRPNGHGLVCYPILHTHTHTFF